MADVEAVPSVQVALAQVMVDVKSVAKRDVNQQQRFNFRGIDAVVNAVGPALRERRVIVLPEVREYVYGSIAVGKDGDRMMGHVRVTVAYTFYGPAGDHITAVTCGEAMDAGDKATPKAMSVAFRTALLQALALPTDEPDPDSQTYERAPASAAEAPPDNGRPLRVEDRHLSALFATMTDANLPARNDDERAQRRAEVSQIIERPLDSFKDLTLTEFRTVMDRLKAVVDRLNAPPQEGGQT